MPASMVSDSEECSSSEEMKKDKKSSKNVDMNYVEGKIQEKIARYGGKEYTEFQPQNEKVASWLHEGVYHNADMSDYQN